MKTIALLFWRWMWRTGRTTMPVHRVLSTQYSSDLDTGDAVRDRGPRERIDRWQDPEADS